MLLLSLEDENVELKSWGKNDWYIARKHERTYILEVICIIRDLIEAKVAIKREDMTQRILGIQSIHLLFVKRAANEDWQKLRTIVRNMQKKYNNESDDDIGYKEFIEAARLHWRTRLM